MEEFMLDVIFRVAMSDLTKIPRSRNLFIDEQISVLDRDHIINIKDTFAMLQPFYDHVLIITHVEDAVQAFDGLIQIKKNNNGSFLDFGNGVIMPAILYPNVQYDKLAKIYHSFENICKSEKFDDNTKTINVNIIENNTPITVEPTTKSNKKNKTNKVSKKAITVDI